MKYLHRKNLYTATIHVISKKIDDNCILVANTKQALREMIKDTIKTGLKNNHTVMWNEDTPHQVSVFRSSEFSEYEKKEISEYIITTSHTYTRKGDFEYNVTKRRNPDYEYNPECGFCYKKSTKLYDVTLLGTAKTPKKVCYKCKHEINKMRNIMDKIEIKN